jgi:hypothetical protein
MAEDFEALHPPAQESEEGRRHASILDAPDYLASPYKDCLDAEWMWREEEDIDRAEEVNALWEFDYDEMGKAEHDYGKYRDACFFGIAVEDWSHFDRDSLTPIPRPLGAAFDLL